MRNTRGFRIGLRLACGLAVFDANALSAQVLRGTVVLADERTAASGVIVVLENAAGAVAGRALSDERGAFTLRLAAGGTYHGRVLRIGFQPTVIPAIRVADTGITPLSVVLTASPIMLPTVAVRGQDICRGRGNDGPLVAQVWEEARKALMASEMSTEDAQVFAEWIEYERTLDTTSRFVRAQRVRTTRSATNHAFRSAPSSHLAERGYVEDTDDGTVFHAPDAEVLLSDSFAALHCFYLQPAAPERAHLIGVGFRPANVRRRVSDIEGTFWIDRASSELRALEYSYTNLPPITERVRPGGEVEFLRLPTGSWLINQWNIRMPQLVQTAPVTMRRRGVTVRGSGTAIQAVRVVGGEVARVQRDDSTLYLAHGASLSVHVTSADSAVSPRDTRISLDGSDYAVITDSGGRAAFSPVLAGGYRIRAQTPLMDSLGVIAQPVDVTVPPDGSRHVTISLPTAAELLQRVCGDATGSAARAHARGEVVDSAGFPIAQAAVRLTWQQRFAVVGDRVLWDEQSRDVETDSLGSWQLCDVPRDVGVSVRVASSAGQGRGTLRLAAADVFSSARVTVRQVSEATGPDAATVLEATAAVTFSVDDSTARPVRDALITVSVPDGPTRRLRTDSLGRASVSELPPGTLTVDVRKVGFAAGTLTATVERGANTIPVVLLRSVVPRLGAVRVVGNRVTNARHAEFMARRERGDATASVTAEEIARRQPASTWQMLTRLPSLQLIDSLGYVYAKSARMSSYLCWLRLSIDGIVQPGRPNLAMLPPPSEIFGIEIFAGSARLPLTMGGEGEDRICGLISVWTK